jgi:hypothetical protein
MTWTVVVREKENLVRVYCPDCINKAQKIIKDFEEKVKNNVKTTDQS